jgi:hypothetical protein
LPSLLPGVFIAVPSLLNCVGELLPLVADDMADAVSDEKASIADQ